MSAGSELFFYFVVWIGLGICFGQNNSILTPVLTKIRTIVSDPTANIRDPTAVLFDPITKTWNFWATKIPKSKGKGGYPGRIYHYYSSELNVANWSSSGLAINVSSNPDDFDYFGVFTPGLMYNYKQSTTQWIIYYGGVRNGSSSHTEQVGMAISNNGIFGPFIKNKTVNPVIKLEDIFWCNTSGNARVDEAKPYIIKNRKMIYTKGVCNNFTALDGIWFNVDNDNSWNTPYKISQSFSPIINSLSTAQNKGFENVKIFLGPDGYLHLTGHNHANSQCPHYVSDDNNNGYKWKFVSYMQSFGQPIYEPAPVYPEGAPGDEGGIPTYFIQFVDDGTKPLYIDLMNVTWK